MRDSGGPDERRGGDEHADTGGGAREAAVADRVNAAAAELYGADQEAFTDRRKALAASAREAGDKSAATAIAALRKPTRAAWVVNRLTRADTGAPPRLAAMAAALRAAEQVKDGPRLRELSRTRGALIDALTEQALAGAGFPDPSPSLRAEVSATLTAALADSDVAAAFTAGTLTRAVQWSGFGLALDDTGAGVGSGAGAGPGPGAGASQGPAPGAGEAPDEEVRAVPAQRSAAARTAARQQAEEAQRREAAAQQVAADQAARHREQYEDAEHAVAAASAAAADATSAEDRLEAGVRDLEQRLTQARADLAAARMRARRAEAAERRACQALDRLPRPRPYPGTSSPGHDVAPALKGSKVLPPAALRIRRNFTKQK